MEVSVVYMVAGLSSRFGGKIKQFAKVGPNGESLIEYSLNQALKAGVGKVIFIVGGNTKAPFKEMFGTNYGGVPVFYAKQEIGENRDKPWGTTDALVSAKEVISGPYIICNGDDIYGESSFKILVDFLKHNSSSATVGYKLGGVIPKKGTTNRGIFEVENGKIKGIKEVFDIEKGKLGEKNLTEESLCSMNLFGLQRNSVDLLGQVLDEFKEQNKGDRKVECLLPEELSNLIKEGKIGMSIFEAKDKWFGVTNPEDEVIVKKQLEKIHKG